MRVFYKPVTIDPKIEPAHIVRINELTQYAKDIMCTKN